MMELKGDAKLLRIFLGEADKVNHRSLAETIVREARAAGLAGATAWRGLAGFGCTSRLRTDRILDLSSDLPVVIEMVDAEAKLDAFLPRLHALFATAGCGGLITLEKVQIVKYAPAGSGTGEPAA